MSTSNLFFALAGGILPALLWLWFWLKEDRLHPEPRKTLLLTFLAGMVVVALALPLEQLANYGLKKLGLITAFSGTLLLFVWAGIEEFCKYIAAKKTALTRPEFDEPIDAVIYLITAALGFAAMENVIFLISVTTDYGFMAGFVTGNLRFAGATLLHILSSAIIGSAIAFSFYKQKLFRLKLIIGLFLATVLHTTFNFFIIRSTGDNIFQIFFPLWILIIVLLFVFEKIKKLKKLTTNKNI
ncbi:PrsW family intramembrane metalloprotease [Patescibacteria group bacterium]